MRGLIFLLLLPTFAWAETLVIQSTPTEVEIQQRGALVTREVTFDMPAGQHSIVLPDLPVQAEQYGMRAQLTGAVLQSLTVRDSLAPLPPELDRPEIAVAETAVEAAQDALAVVQDQMAALQRTIAAAAAQTAFLADLARSESLPQDAATLAEIAQMIGTQTEAAAASAAEARVAMRPLARTEAARRDALKRAEAALDALLTAAEARNRVTLVATTPEAGPVTLRLTYLVRGAGWEPTYGLRLTTGDAPSFAVDRAAWITQVTGEDWVNVVLTVSTADTSGQSAPARLFPRRLQMFEPVPTPTLRSSDALVAGAPADPVIEAPVIVEEKAALLDGATARYVFPERVTVANGADQVRLALDTLTLSPEVFARAVPDRDDVAYRMARVTNTAPEIILPGEAELFVDGQLIGFGEMPLLAPGAEAELGMGPLETLRLTRILRQGTGDTGIITRANERVEQTLLRVENTGAETWPVEIIGRVPFSEQEDLAIDWSATPPPTATDLRDAQGILGWRIELPPNSTRDISVRTRITWPSGMELR
ncbi:MAG: DUF4139 domain-containing protein [Pseudomonadota bacterium]